MASKNWQAGGKVVIPAQAIVCLIGTLVPFGAARAEANGFAVHRASIEEFEAQKQITYQWAASSKRCGPTRSCRSLLRRYD